MPKEILKYSNNEITVVWQPRLCTHATLCWKGLSTVFNPKVRPWVNMQGSNTETIKAQVARCPSGALTIEEIKQTTVSDEPTPLNTTGTETMAAAPIAIQMVADGPALLQGTCVITLPDGRTETKEGTVALCRCGASANKPYCDGSHINIGFKG